ncbi:MAG TPA: hypothetical protein DCR46_04785, partial [Cytophagales bacterium]|nr:hypothetical protein [Cytophagales bacterium]
MLSHLMKKIIPKQISLIFLFCSSIFIELFGQGQANVWYFGDNIGLDFNTSPPTLLKGMTPVDGNTNIMESAASISDASGKFLFGTNGKDIYSADRQIRGALPYTFNAFSVAQGALIIPRPGSTTDYYLSSISYTGCSSANPAAYQTITVSGTTGNNITIGATTYLSDNGNGITQGQMVLPRTDIAGNLTGDFWLVHHEWNSNNFIIYSVSFAGITYVKKVSAGVVVNGECSDVTAFFKANACYNQFVYNFGGSTYLFDFDTRTAAITNRNSVNIPEAYGVEFSKNGKWVYVCSGTFTQTPTVYKIPVTPGGVTGSTLGSATQIGNPYGNIRGGCLQMGPDGQIYAASFSSWFGTPRTDWIGVVKDPENGGGFTQKYVETTNAQLGMGLPSFITSLVANKVSLDIEGVSSSQASPCVNTPTKLQVNLNGTIVGAVNWRFFLPGNTGTTPDATATGNPITHTYTGLGAHRTVVSVTDACGRNINMEFPTTTVPFQNADATVSASCPKVLTGSGSTSGNYKWYSSNPSSGGTILGIGATYNFAGTNGGSIWVEPAGSVNVVTTSDNRTSSGCCTAAGNTTLTIPTGLSSITEFKIGYYSHSTAISGSFSAELRDANNVKIGSTVSKVISHPSGGINTTATLNPTDWAVTSGSYTVILTATPSGASIGSLSSNSYSANGVSISGGQTYAYTIQTSNETTILSCKTGKSISIPSCCSPSVGTPSAISVSSGTEPTCQLTNATTTTTYSTTATNATGYNWSLSNASAGSINATTGVMTWANGFSGSVDILVTAAGCNGPSSQVKRTVNITSLPSAPAAITFTSPVCAGAINQAVSVVAVTGATSYTW